MGVFDVVTLLGNRKGLQFGLNFDLFTKEQRDGDQKPELRLTKKKRRLTKIIDKYIDFESYSLYESEFSDLCPPENILTTEGQSLVIEIIDFQGNSVEFHCHFNLDDISFDFNEKGRKPQIPITFPLFATLYKNNWDIFNQGIFYYDQITFKYVYERNVEHKYPEFFKPGAEYRVWYEEAYYGIYKADQFDGTKISDEFLCHCAQELGIFVANKTRNQIWLEIKEETQNFFFYKIIEDYDKYYCLRNYLIDDLILFIFSFLKCNSVLEFLINN